MKTEFTVLGIILAATIGWLIGALLEHPIGPGGLQFFGAMLGAMIVVEIVIIAEALKTRK